MGEKIALLAPRSSPSTPCLPPSLYPPVVVSALGVLPVGNGVPQMPPSPSGRDRDLSHPRAPSVRLESSQWALPGNCLQTRRRA